MKKYILLIFIISIISCKNDKTNIQKEVKLVDIPKSIKQLIFNNDLRKVQGMAILDSLEFKGSYIKSTNRVIYEKSANIEYKANEVFKIEFAPKTKDSLILDSYLIGKDSVLRLQSRIRNEKYVISDTYGILFFGENRRFLRLNEIMNVAKAKKLYTEKDSLFYGYVIPKLDTLSIR